MSKRTLSLMLAGTLALLLGLPLLAYSQLPGRGPGFGRGPAFAGAPIAPGLAGPGQRRGPAAGRGFMAPQRRGELGSPGALGMDRRGMRAGAASGLASRALGRAEQLGLTAEQETRLREAERAGRAASIERRATIRIAELDLAELTRTDTPDLAAIEGKLREIGELRIVEQLAGLRLDATARDVLTAEQLEELTRPGRRPSRGR